MPALYLPVSNPDAKGDQIVVPNPVVDNDLAVRVSKTTAVTCGTCPDADGDAVCDVDDNYLGAAGQRFSKATRYNDFRKLLDNKNVDAVLIATQAHWHVLLRARAIETGSFVLAAAQGGTHESGRQTYGHSLIVSPWG